METPTFYGLCASHHGNNCKSQLYFVCNGNAATVLAMAILNSPGGEMSEAKTLVQCRQESQLAGC